MTYSIVERLGRYAIVAAGLAVSGNAAAPRTSPDLIDYARADRLVPLADGRRINVVCTGHGTGPTVILIAGLGLWSFDWRKVQQPLSATMRVCAWDRAGYGHSDPPSGQVTLASSERDLEGWLRAAKVAPPYLVVGHSIGGIEARLFAARTPRAIAGMILVDPTVSDQTASMARIAPGLAALVGDDRQVERCLTASRAATMNEADRSQCIDPPPADASASLRAAWPRISARPSSFAADLTMDRSLPEANRYLVRNERLFGDRPIIVLTAGKSPPVTAKIRAQAERWMHYWRLDHQRIAGLSRDGQERLVPDASHTIEQDDPQAVISAVRDVAAQYEAKPTFPQRNGGRDG